MASNDQPISRPRASTRVVAPRKRRTLNYLFPGSKRGAREAKRRDWIITIVAGVSVALAVALVLWFVYRF